MPDGTSSGGIAANAANGAMSAGENALSTATDPGKAVSDFVDSKPMDPESASDAQAQSSEEQINALMALVKSVNDLVNSLVLMLPKMIIGGAIDAVKDGVHAAKEVVMKPVRAVGSALSGALGDHDQGAEAANQQSAPAPQPQPEPTEGLGL